MSKNDRFLYPKLKYYWLEIFTYKDPPAILSAQKDLANYIASTVHKRKVHVILFPVYGTLYNTCFGGKMTIQ